MCIRGDMIGLQVVYLYALSYLFLWDERCVSFMSLAKQIVVVNEFTNKTNASRGSTPSAYIENYVTRADATEALYPTLVQGRDMPIVQYIEHYMTREDATERAIERNEHAQQLIQQFDAFGRDGRSFGHLGQAYSHTCMQQEAARMQQYFEDGHTILKTVLSFETTYLKNMGVLPSDFEHQRIGDFKGQLDHLKLRMAINDGMRDMAKVGGFVQPEWIGTIQIDTHHVHAHMVMTDASRQTSRKRQMGEEQRGKLHKPEIQALRTGLHRSLRRHKPLHSLKHEVDVARKDSVVKVRDLVAHQTMTSSYLQQLIASLPKDRKKWRYRTNDKEMAHTNMLMDTYIQTLRTTHREASGYDRAEQSIHAYADNAISQYHVHDNRVEQDMMRMMYIQNGTQLLHERIANGIYHQLRSQLQPRDLVVTSPLLQQRAYAKEEYVTQDDSLAQGLARGHTYHDRYRAHMEQAVFYQRYLRDYYEKHQQNGVSLEADAMYRYYQTERLYHMRVVDKYRTFLPLREQVHSLDLRQGYLMNVEQQARTMTTMTKETPYDALMRGIQMVQDSPLYQDADEIQGNHDGSLSVASILQEVHVQPLRPLPFETVHYLNYNGASSTAFGRMGSKLLRWQQQLERGQTYASSDTPTTTRYVQSYLMERDSYQFDMWRSGQLSAEHIDTYIDALTQYEEHGVLEALPVARERSLLGEQSAYVRQIQAYDVHDVAYDLHPMDTRSIHAMHRKTYRHIVHARKGHTEQALTYLQRTHQSPMWLPEHLLQLQHYEMIVDVMDEEEEIPYPSDVDYQQPLSDRYLYAISLDKSYEFVQQHLTLTQHEVVVIPQDTTSILRIDDKIMPRDVRQPVPPPPVKQKANKVQEDDSGLDL